MASCRRVNNPPQVYNLPHKLYSLFYPIDDGVSTVEIYY
jgi:hypothetical protein